MVRPQRHLAVRLVAVSADSSPSKHVNPDPRDTILATPGEAP
jgi:hypothetical protein